MSKCPFCKTNLNTGATTCAACGAYKQDYGKGLKNHYIQTGIAALALSCIFLAWGILPDPEDPAAIAFVGVLLGIPAVGSLLFGVITSFIKPTWVAKN